MNKPLENVSLDTRMNVFQERLANAKTEKEIATVLWDLSLDREVLEELRKINPNLAIQVDASVMRHWLPRGTPRKIIMAVMLIVGILGAFSSGWMLLFVVAALAFSPRVIGELAILIGTLKNNP